MAMIGSPLRLSLALVDFVQRSAEATFILPDRQDAQ